MWIGVWFWYGIPTSLCVIAMGHIGLSIARRRVQQDALHEPRDARPGAPPSVAGES